MEAKHNMTEHISMQERRRARRRLRRRCRAIRKYMERHPGHRDHLHVATVR